MKQPRKLWIDIFKFVGIFFVAGGHIFRGRTVNLIYSFHMPFFVIVSGYNSYFTVKRQQNIPFRERFKNILKNILPVVIFLNFFKIVSGLIVNGLSVTTLKHYLKLMVKTNYKYIFNGGEINLPYAGATWFLFHLVIVMLVHTELTKYLEDKTRFLLTMFLYFFSIPTDFANMRYLPLNINSSLVSLLYFELGFLFHKYEYEIINFLKNKISSTMYVPFLIFSLILLFYISTLNIGISLRTLEYGNLLYSTLTTIGIPVIFMLLFIELEFFYKKIRAVSFLQITGKNALYVLGIDSSIKFVLTSFYPELIETRFNRILLVFMVVSVIVMIANIFEFFLEC